jgi:uncharacterized protein (TIGR00290 family)
MKRIVLSWSSGKDSAWALDVLRARGDVEVVGLVTTVNPETDRVAVHAVPRALLRAQAAAVGLPLDEVEIPSPCPNAVYERAMAGAVARARARGVEAFAFGDLFLEDIRRYREAQLDALGMGSMFPLWGADTTELAREMVAGGLRAIVTCVDPKQLDRSFAGRRWDRALAALPAGVDPCGENGELHTFAYAGPGFAQRVAVEAVATREQGGFVYAELRPAPGGPER